MTTDDLYNKITIDQPKLIYISGKTCVGKSTFANKLHDTLGYEIISLDAIIIENVIRPLDITDQKNAFVEIYKKRDDRQLLDLFVSTTQNLVSIKQAHNQPTIIDGAISNIETLMELFARYPELNFIYIHPEDLNIYKRNLTNRFMLADATSRSGLPKRFWDFIDKDEFQLFCENRIITPRLAESIVKYANSSQQESEKRLATFQTKFAEILVGTI
jgi:guanylate kinase